MRHTCGVRKKLVSRRGAAILIALLVFFLAALSGTVALTMSASNAGRYTHEKEDRQAYLSVLSAANIILDRLDGIEIVYESTVGGFPDANQVVISYVSAEGKDDLFFGDPRFQQNLQAFAADKTMAQTVDFLLSVDTATEMGRVYVNVKISGGEIYFKLYAVNGSNRDYMMTMKLKITFPSGMGNFIKEDDGVFMRRMGFDTKNVKYTVEENTGS